VKQPKVTKSLLAIVHDGVLIGWRDQAPNQAQEHGQVGCLLDTPNVLDGRGLTGRIAQA